MVILGYAVLGTLFVISLVTFVVVIWKITTDPESTKYS